MGLKSSVLTTRAATAVLTVQFSDLSITNVDEKEEPQQNFLHYGI